MKKLLGLWIRQDGLKNRVKERVKQALDNENGQGMVEYGLIIALVAVVVIVMLTNVGNSIVAKFTTINQNLQ